MTMVIVEIKRFSIFKLICKYRANKYNNTRLKKSDNTGLKNTIIQGSKKITIQS